MELHQLLYFCHVARVRSFTRATEEEAGQQRLRRCVEKPGQL
jgi:hypothetical protein